MSRARPGVPAVRPLPAGLPLLLLLLLRPAAVWGECGFRSRPERTAQPDGGSGQAGAGAGAGRVVRLCPRHPRRLWASGTRPLGREISTVTAPPDPRAPRPPDAPVPRTPGPPDPLTPRLPEPPAPRAPVALGRRLILVAPSSRGSAVRVCECERACHPAPHAGPPYLVAGNSDCGLPAQVPNAQPTLGDLQSFPEGHTVTYKCKEGFEKIPGKPDSVVCLPSHQWSELGEFCNRSCKIPPRLNYAFLKKEYSKQNYFPVGSIVEYECRPGYRKDITKSEKLTCLPSLEWSKPTEFCQKRSCPNPGEIQNGAINIKTDILFGSSISFSCNKGFKLVGATSSYCVLTDNTVGWSDPLPECVEIYCPDPPVVKNGIMRGESNTYTYSQTVSYECTKGFTLVGNSSLYCDIKDDDRGEWSSPPPQCKEKSSPTQAPATPQKPTTVKVLTPGAPPTHQKPTSGKVPGTGAPPTPQKPTRVNVPTTRVPPTHQKPTRVKVPTTDIPPSPQRPTKADVPPPSVPPTAQTPTTRSAPPTEGPPAPQKPTTAHAPTPTAPPTVQKLTTGIVSDTDITPTPQKPTDIDDPTVTVPPSPQKPTTVNISDSKVSSTAQNPTTSNNSATKALVTAQTFLTPKTLPTNTPLAGHKPNRTASATQTTPPTHRVTTAKASLTQRPPAAHKSTTSHVPMTKSLQITQRFTSARITATHHAPGSRTTVGFHATKTSKGTEMSTSGVANYLYGHTWVTLTVLLVTLVILG
ncbi:complement decay-accelerating factor [Dipodomys spectabilis]|uniref:complement decay-accelerating factor n=1 Tax=Dipodomys spectabilis TaxID=105255 RepID=UPI001C53B32B|nr:complement decay-accelerating factor [Dipodomys spectabilis]